jgi:hypothetical protein
MIFSFGQSEKERLAVDVVGYERAPVGEYFDDNWLIIEIRVQAGNFQCKTKAAILTDELIKFSSELRVLFETLKGSAAFTTLEEQLSLQLTGDGKGHIELCGEVEAGHRLIFTLQFDQSQLGRSIHEIEKVLSQFPIRSSKATE